MNEFIRKWTTEELIVHFGLTENDLATIKPLQTGNKLPFAILYKWFQTNKCFPETKNAVDPTLVEFLSQELKENQQTFNDYAWDSRSFRRHCEDIRTLFGYKNITDEEIDDLRNWLQLEVLPEYGNNDVIYEMAIQRHKALKLIPQPKDSLMRMIISESSKYEKQLLDKIFKLISSDLIKEIDSFVDQKDEKKIYKKDYPTLFLSNL